MSLPPSETKHKPDMPEHAEEPRAEDTLFLEYHRTHDPALRDRLVQTHMNLVRFLARKFANRGEAMDDLIGVGTIGLLNAIDRFDPERGIRFATFATPTIVGEIKRYFRDHGWAIKVPRRLQEVNLAANKAVERLSAKLNRPPTAQEVAEEIGASLEETLEGMELGQMYDLVSLDHELTGEDDDSHSRLEEFVGAEDTALDELGEHSQLESALRQLPERERLIILLRFFKGWSQLEVARVMRISQMHVSRLQAKAQARLREILMESEK